MANVSRPICDAEWRLTASDTLTFLTESMDYFESLEDEKSETRPEDISIVFLDVLMPYYNGYEIARRIRQIESNCGSQRRTPIVGLSGNFRQDDRLEGIRGMIDAEELMYETLPILMCYSPIAGFDEFLVKPVSHQVIKKYLLQHGNHRTECKDTICT